MTLSIIIVNWNVKALLEKCLESIRRETKDLDYEVIVVDNASQDGSREFLNRIMNNESGIMDRKRKLVKIILNNRNLGFSRANNQALKISRGDFILFLNPDTEIFPNSLHLALNFMRQNKSCGILGGQLLDNKNQTQFSVRRFPGLWSQILVLLKVQHWWPQCPILKKYFVWSFNYGQVQTVDQVMGAFLLTRRETMKQLGGFDEKFFLWFEDVDLCWRAKQAKWSVIYHPDVKVKHYSHQSFLQVLSYPKQKIYNQSLIYFFRKNYSLWSALILSIFVPLSLFLALVVQPFHAFLKSYYEFRKF